MNTARCPSCRSDVIVEDDSYEGDIFDCANCGAQSELTALHPPQLRLVESEDEIGLDVDENDPVDDDPAEDETPVEAKFQEEPGNL